MTLFGILKVLYIASYPRLYNEVDLVPFSSILEHWTESSLGAHANLTVVGADRV